jgi:integrase
MVITITMKNYVIRNGIYYFRLAVPKDCQVELGKREILQSLKTSDELEAVIAIDKLTKKWKKRFKDIRAGSSEGRALAPHAKKSNESTKQFRQQLADFVEANVPDYLDSQSREVLIECSRFCRDVIIEATRDGDDGFDLQHLLGVDYPPPKQQSPGEARRAKKVYVDLLSEIRIAIDEELGHKVSELVDKEINGSYPELTQEASWKTKPVVGSSDSETDILTVTNLMLKSKDIDGVFKELVLSEVTNFTEWCLGKSDLSTYTKADVVSYVRNCLPYLPKNRYQRAAYKNKTLKQCVEMTKGDPVKYVPVSHRTCENRFGALSSVFNYAKEYLGVVPINLAKGVEIPVVRQTGGKPRSFTGDEIIAMWTKLGEVLEEDGAESENYWVTVLALYHGARQNEMCSLLLEDVYTHEDGTFIVDINDKGPKKKLKNKSSKRLVPLHPYVLNNLQFKEYVKKRKVDGKAGDLLFPNLTYSEKSGYGRRISRWFNKWKTEWLDEECYYKNFHSLRHTFIQQAQNQAKMSDRCTQEITGHSVTSVSAVHRGYSGRLLPKAVLEELAKVEYKLTE